MPPTPKPDPAAAERQLVKFTRWHNGYRAGELAGFPPADAARLCDVDQVAERYVSDADREKAEAAARKAAAAAEKAAKEEADRLEAEAKKKAETEAKAKGPAGSGA